MKIAKDTYVSLWGGALLIAPVALALFSVSSVGNLAENSFEVVLQASVSVAKELSDSETLAGILVAIIFGGAIAGVLFYLLLGGIGIVLLLVLRELQDLNRRLLSRISN